MHTQSVKTPSEGETVTLRLSSSDYYLLLGISAAVTEFISTAQPSDCAWLEEHINESSSHRSIRDLNFKLQDTNIGDACRHSAHIPEVSGQGGNITFTLTPQEHNSVVCALDSYQRVTNSTDIKRLHNKVKFLQTQAVPLVPVRDVEQPTPSGSPFNCSACHVPGKAAIHD